MRIRSSPLPPMTYATRPRSSARRGNRSMGLEVRQHANIGTDPLVSRLDRVVAMVRDLRETFMGIQNGAAR